MDITILIEALGLIDSKMLLRAIPMALVGALISIVKDAMGEVELRHTIETVLEQREKLNITK